MQDFNSVPFMGILYLIFKNLDKLYLLHAGKRSEERGDAGVRSGGIMVRRPR